MATETVTAKVKIKDEETGKVVDEEEVSTEYDFGNSHADMVSEYGEDIVFHHARASMRVALQGALRIFFNAGKRGAELVSEVEKWQMPSGKPRGKSKLERAKETVAKLSDTERQAFLEELGM